MKNATEFKNGIGQLTGNHKDILEKINELERILTRLRYEGKVNFGKNSNALGEILQLLEVFLLMHVKKEEILFSPTEMKNQKARARFLANGCKYKAQCFGHACIVLRAYR